MKKRNINTKLADMRNHNKEKALLEDKAHVCSGAASELSRGTIIHLYFRSRNLGLKVKVPKESACTQKHTCWSPAAPPFVSVYRHTNKAAQY